MDPFLGPVASALVAAVCAGATLGLVRLRRLSLEWWNRRGRAGAARHSSPDPPLEPEPGAPDLYDADQAAAARSRAFRDANLMLLSAGIAGALGVAIALTVARTGLAGSAATTWRDVARALTTAPLALFVAVAVAIALAGADRLLGLSGEWAGFRPRGPAFGVPDLMRAARLLWSGSDDTGAPAREPFGVGLAYVALFASAVAAWGAVLPALTSGSAPLPFLGGLLLAVPLAYAAAAERSHRGELARLRQIAAGRQLAIAPAWAMALAAVGGGVGVAGGGVAGAGGVAIPIAAFVWATLAVVLAAPIALPGMAAGTALASWPQGGDQHEPSAAVRMITSLAHYAWLGAIALAFGVSWAGASAPAGGGAAGRAWVALGAGAGMILLVLVLRAAAGLARERARVIVSAAALAAGLLALAASRAGIAP